MNASGYRAFSLWLGLFIASALSTLACDAVLNSAAKMQGSASGSSNVLGALNAASCPALVAGGSALNTKFSSKVKANIKVAAFVQAAKDLSGLASKAEADLTRVCKKMGSDLGVSAQAMKPVEGPGGAAKGACSAVATRISAILKGGVSIKVVATPPKCHVNASAQAACEGSCSIQATPGEIVANCEPAQLSGTCQGTCKGQCDGTCTGKCQGECSAKDAQGNCVGQCSGTCTGKCSATCHASCEGTWKAPKCEASAKAPTVDADCKASCKASADIKAQCSKPTLTITTSKNSQLVAQLVATLKTNLPTLLAIQFHLGKQIAADLKVLATLSGQLPKQLKGAGGTAIACVTASAAAIVRASASIKVSMQVSASVSANVGAQS